MTKNTTNEAVVNFINTIRETNQTIAENAIAAQERNMALAQNIFENGIEVLKSHAETTRTFIREQVEQAQKRQGDFKGLSDSVVAAQERNIKFAQSVIENSTEVLKSQVEGARTLTQTLIEQSKKQQAAFETFTAKSLDLYADFFNTPATYYKQAVETAEEIARQGVETAQKITRKGVEAVQNASRQGQKDTTTK
jgi:hypothetical protein